MAEDLEYRAERAERAKALAEAVEYRAELLAEIHAMQKPTCRAVYLRRKYGGTPPAPMTNG
jgi:hypothetical protein